MCKFHKHSSLGKGCSCTVCFIWLRSLIHKYLVHNKPLKYKKTTNNNKCEKYLKNIAFSISFLYEFHWQFLFLQSEKCFFSIDSYCFKVSYVVLSFGFQTSFIKIVVLLYWNNFLSLIAFKQMLVKWVNDCYLLEMNLCLLLIFSIRACIFFGGKGQILNTYCISLTTSQSSWKHEWDESKFQQNSPILCSDDIPIKSETLVRYI